MSMCASVIISNLLIGIDSPKQSPVFEWANKHYAVVNPDSFSAIIGFDHATRHLIRSLQNDLNTSLHIFDTNSVTIIAIPSSISW
ncbi:unnamed protein product [Ilex paraguariensis]|uniref:Uncharacterized protein n=1 Tax=Ilex paraguariensis TaxID=185542 RepID=A0ABC8UZU3_9AQUA